MLIILCKSACSNTIADAWAVAAVVNVLVDSAPLTVVNTLVFSYPPPFLITAAITVIDLPDCPAGTVIVALEPEIEILAGVNTAPPAVASLSTQIKLSVSRPEANVPLVEITSDVPEAVAVNF